MANIIVVLIILSIVAVSISRVIYEKRKGVRCVGCPLSGECSSNKGLGHRVVAQRIEIKNVT